MFLTAALSVSWVFLPWLNQPVCALVQAHSLFFSLSSLIKS